MKRLRSLICLCVVSVMLLVGCSNGEGTEPAMAGESAGDRAAAVDVIAQDLLAYPRAEFTSDEEPRCVADAVVDGLGLERLTRVGLDIDTGKAPTLWQPELTEAEGDVVYAAYDDCLDFESSDIERFMADGLSRAQAQCASDAYRASGIPRVHGLEPPHTGEPDSVEAHAHLEAFINATKTACRAWIQP
jgi:hypothetical protein